MQGFFKRTRVRLTLTYATIFLVAAAFAGAACWSIFFDRVYGGVDDKLDSAKDQVAASLAHSDWSGPIQFPSTTSQGVSLDVYLFRSDGAPVTANAGNWRFARAQIPESGFPERPALSTVHTAGGEHRVMVARVSGAGQTGGLVLVRPTEELHQSFMTTTALLAAIIATLVIVACLLAYWLSGRALVPVREMAATAHDISEHDLHERIRIDLPEGDELGDLARTFNDMLNRLESSFETLQQFTADAAHELRAPLAVMRAQVEIALRQPRRAEAYRATIQAALKEVLSMSRTVDQLLLLARADAGQLDIAHDVFDLPDLLEETAARWGAVAVERSIDLRSVIPPAGEIRGDRGLIRRLLDNLLSNAIRQTPEGGQVELSAEAAGDQWQIALSDSGPGVTSEARARIFERFYRVDRTRRRGHGNAGLGLALSKTIVELHGGRIWLSDTPSELGGARFVVRLPRPPESAPPRPGAPQPKAAPR